MTASQKAHIDAVCRAFAHGLRETLGPKLFGAYVYGAAAFPDSVPPAGRGGLPTGDIDFHVILREPLTEEERGRLCALHQTLARDHPPLGKGMDGYYIQLADAKTTTPPVSGMWQRATDNSWALHCAHIRAGRCITLHGPDPRQVYPEVTWAQIEVALQGEFAYVEEHLSQYPDYCILNLCRLIYSYETRDVVISKAAAAAWACEAYPQWVPLIDLARKSYTGQGTHQERAEMVAGVGAMCDFARQRIARTKAT